MVWIPVVFHQHLYEQQNTDKSPATAKIEKQWKKKQCKSLSMLNTLPLSIVLSLSFSLAFKFDLAVDRVHILCFFFCVGVPSRFTEQLACSILIDVCVFARARFDNIGLDELGENTVDILNVIRSGGFYIWESGSYLHQCLYWSAEDLQFSYMFLLLLHFSSLSGAAYSFSKTRPASEWSGFARSISQLNATKWMQIKCFGSAGAMVWPVERAI